jgi:hypothetical protein
VVLGLLEIPAVELIELGIALPDGLLTADGLWRALVAACTLHAVARNAVARDARPTTHVVKPGKQLEPGGCRSDSTLTAGTTMASSVVATRGAIGPSATIRTRFREAVNMLTTAAASG